MPNEEIAFMNNMMLKNWSDYCNMEHDAKESYISYDDLIDSDDDYLCLDSLFN